MVRGPGGGDGDGEGEGEEKLLVIPMLGRVLDVERRSRRPGILFGSLYVLLMMNVEDVMYEHVIRRSLVICCFKDNVFRLN